MSHVVNVILKTHIEDGNNDKVESEYPNVDLFNKLINEREFAQGNLQRVDQYCGGRKAMECDIFLAAFNYPDVDGLIEVLNEVPWDNRDCVQLWIQGQHVDLFTEYKPIEK